MTFMRTRIVAIALSMLGLAAAVPASAQPKPSSAIEVIVPWGPSGGADQMARKTAKMLEGALGAPVTVTNIPGATGNKGMAKLLKSAADGHSMAVLNADTYALLAYANPGWKPADVVPLAIMTVEPSALFLPANSRFGSWADVEKEARAKPRSLKVAITGLGSTDYIVLQQLAVSGVRFTPVPYGNPQERYAAVLRGDADVLYEQPGDLREMIESRQLRPVLVFSAERMPRFNDVPTAKERSLPAGVRQFRALVVKAGTDPQRIRELSAALDKVAATPEYSTMLKEQWASEPSYVNAAGAGEAMKRELAAMKAIVDQFPLHARHLFDESVESYVEPF